MKWERFFENQSNPVSFHLRSGSISQNRNRGIVLYDWMERRNVREIEMKLHGKKMYLGFYFGFGLREGKCGSIERGESEEYGDWWHHL